MATAVGVTVTGMEFVAPLGLSLDEAWPRAVRGESGIGPLRRFDATGRACRTSGEVAPFDLAPLLRSPKNEKFMSQSVRCAMRAAAGAVAASGLAPGSVDPSRVALYIGSGQTGLESADFFDALEVAWTGDEERDFANLGGRAARLLDRYFSLRTLANAGLGLVSAELGAKGPSDNFVQGETASAQAIAAGVHDLTEGRADVAIVGGYDSLLDVSTYLAYEAAGLLSSAGPEEAHRPFDRQRDGVVPAEGAAFLVLERAQDARRREAPVLGEVGGAGLAMDLGEEPSEGAMRRAVEEATGGAPPDFVVARGIGTGEGDRREASHLRAVFGASMPVTAFKGLTGYLGAATAAAELCLALRALTCRRVPPVARHAAADPECSLDLVTGSPRPLVGERPGAVCLSRSWLGQCAALVARAPDA